MNPEPSPQARRAAEEILDDFRHSEGYDPIMTTDVIAEIVERVTGVGVARELISAFLQISADDDFVGAKSIREQARAFLDRQNPR